MKKKCGRLLLFLLMVFMVSLEAAPKDREVTHTITISVPSLAILRLEFPTVLMEFNTLPTEPVDEDIIGEGDTTFSFVSNESNKKIVASIAQPIQDSYIYLEAAFTVDGQGQGEATSLGWHTISTTPVTLVDDISQAYYKNNTIQYRLHVGLGATALQGDIEMNIELVDQ
ncbi:MAG: hypothetical protein HN411_03250 [Waddliaceae bacterium]|jgi:hypothetical protein|nr:hypothetical protein [Waddliaceae bacterium]MBT3578931.1 hypothetical protein [Waddliaceae bacterium]MBT4445510.1 hypothetical protein [Waddliaceae bacterium]MBT6929001.1 hypothetical protein [Waddliaceae bacterium]MBT7263999.1 hypothetical protein [Waddliaceae bacterium]